MLQRWEIFCENNYSKFWLMCMKNSAYMVIKILDMYVNIWLNV